MSRSNQLFNQGLRQNHDIARRTAHQFVAHHAHGAESAVDAVTGSLFELGLDGFDHCCGCAATQNMHVVFSIKGPKWPLKRFSPAWRPRF
jgi:hypothetical protein